MRRTLFYNFFILTLLVTMSLPASAQQVVQQASLVCAAD